MAKQDDGLFLLEVLIDKIVFVKSPCFSDKDFRTCVNIDCPSVEPLEICDDDPGACIAKSGGPFVKTFNNGKSCLFSLKEADIGKAMSRFPIKVSVYKSLPCGCLPTKIVMGEATIDMTKEFVQARKKYLEDPNNVSYQALKDSFRIVGPDGTETGEIVMFLRISCFGKLIITRFQGTGGPPNLGAGGGSSGIVDRSCNPRKEFQTTQDPCACGAARGAGGAGGQSGGGGGGFGSCPIARDPYNSIPCEDPDDPCFCSGLKPGTKQQMECRNTDQYCLHVPKDCCPTGNKVIFQLPSDSCGMGHKQRAYFNFSSDGVGDVTRDDPGQLMSPTAEDYPGVVYDFPKQVIKLRIGKMVELPGRKSKLEYQFITPVVTHDREVPVRDTRTSQCVPCCTGCCPSKFGVQPSLPFSQLLSEEHKMDILTTCHEVQSCNNSLLMSVKKPEHPDLSQATVIVNECLNIFIDNIKFPVQSYGNCSTLSNAFSSTSLPYDYDHTLRSKKRSVSFSDSVDCISQSYSQHFMDDSYVFGKKETTIYMTVYDEFSHQHNSATQATASVNKCLQAVCDYNGMSSASSRITINQNYYSSSNASTIPCRQITNRIVENRHYSDVYFFGRKKEPKSGMGSSSKTKLHKSGNIAAAPVRSEKRYLKGTASVQVQSQCCTATAQTKKTHGSSAATCTGKAVSIKDDKSDRVCPAGGIKADMVATVSHIRIGPRDPCPVHGRDPCQGPKCIVASSGEEQAPVKVSTVINPRRGVFELVIRRMNGAPLAKNELMLEWTPPPSRPPHCGSPCSIPCSPPGPCLPTKCKMIVCRPPLCKPKCCKKVCRKPCGPMPCSSIACKQCCRLSCCGISCQPCKPCPPPKCRSCPVPKRRPCLPYKCRPCRPCFPIKCRPCSPIKCRPCSPIKCKPCSLNKCRPCSSIKRSLCSPIKCRPCSPVKCRPCSPIKCRPCSPIKCRPCSPIKCRPCRPCSPVRCRPCPPPRCRPCPSLKCRPCPPVRCRPCPPPKCRPCPRPKCRPCPAPKCRPCSPSPCESPCSPPCCRSPCTLPCKSSPCLRPCPVGRKKPRKARSQPRIKSHRKRISPCYNRSNTCPVVRCRSVPGPCFGCCVSSCSPRKCCSVAPCNSLKCCKSSCSLCCG